MAFPGDPSVMHFKTFAIDRHQIGTRSWRDRAEFAPKSEKFGWMPGSEFERVRQRYAQQADTIANGASHVEAASGKTAVLPFATAVTYGNFLAIECKCGVGAADRRHRVSDQNWSTEAAQCKPQHWRRDVNSVNNEPVPHISTIECRSNRSRFA